MATTSHRKDQAFRNIVGEPADHFIDLFWARLLPYISVAEPGQRVEYRLLVRNNFERTVTYEARLQPPTGWEAQAEFATLKLDAGGRGEIALAATASPTADGVRRLTTAEIRIDGQSQGPLVEALVTVKGGAAGE